jgi:DNA-binding transcriptional regulator YiaG
MVFRATHRHYEHVASELTLKATSRRRAFTTACSSRSAGLQRAVVEALRYAETLSDDVRAIYVDVNPAQTEQLRKDWDAWGGASSLSSCRRPSAR